MRKIRELLDEKSKETTVRSENKEIWHWDAAVA